MEGLEQSEAKRSRTEVRLGPTVDDETMVKPEGGSDVNDIGSTTATLYLRCTLQHLSPRCTALTMATAGRWKCFVSVRVFSVWRI